MAITDNNIFNWLELVSKVPPALWRRSRPDPAETMVPQPGYEMGGMSDTPEVTMPPAREPASFVPSAAAPSPAAGGFEMGGFQNAALQLPFAQRGPAAARRYTPPVSSKIATSPAQMAAPAAPAAASQSGFSLIPAAAAAEPEATHAFFSEPSTTPDVGGNGNVMARLQGYLDRLSAPRDRSGENIDNALALMIGGLNTMAAASRPGATPFGSFAEGNAGGLNTMLALRGQRRREESDNDREALGVMGTMANLENAAATRADTKAYRDATLASAAADRSQRAQEFATTSGFNRDKLREDQRQADINAGIRRDTLAAEAPVRQSQVAENNARAKYYDEGGRAAGGQDPADVREIKFRMENGESYEQATQNVRLAKTNPEALISANIKAMTESAGMPGSPSYKMTPEQITEAAVNQYQAMMQRLRGGGGQDASAVVGGVGGHYAGDEPPPTPGARRASDGKWYVPDPNSKSGWGAVINR